MILKKPYAFLIRYFKIIHLILLAFITYITLSFNKVVNFFKTYVSSNQILYENIAKNYIPLSIFLALIIVIAFSILMYLLMHKKRKPNNFYIATGIYYIILFIASIYAYNVINTLHEMTLTQQISRAYRDIYQILLLPNFYFIVISFIRGIGFDVKKFNFSKDLEELEIKKEDSEEFEFVLGTDTYKLKRKTRRTLRELKYYILENKVFISIILISITLVSLIYIGINITFINPTYNLGDTLKTPVFTYKVNNAYISSYDYSGEIIKKDKKYLIVNMSIKSNLSPSAIKPEYIYLKIGSEVINYKTTLKESFSDLGNSYNNDKIGTEYINQLFIFELDKTTKNKTFKLNIFDKIEYNNGTNEYIYRKYNIKAYDIDQKYNEINKNLAESFQISEKVFGTSLLNIKSSSIVQSYEYNYETCTNDSCKKLYNIELPTNSTKNDLLVVNYELNLDTSTEIYKKIENNHKLFFDKFIKVRYTKNNNTYETNIISRINSKLNNIIFIDIPKHIQDSDTISFVVSTRSEKYSIKIK